MAMVVVQNSAPLKESIFIRFIRTPAIHFARNLKKNFWLDSTVVIRKNESDAISRQRVILLIDSKGFDFRVCAVAATGFLSDSYNLFATNAILPSLGYVYWPSVSDGSREFTINVATLGGSAIGMLLFGYLADRFGRRKLYGIELIVVFFGTIGVVEASAGYDGSMNIMGWLIFWRFFTGLGIGAEYPLSAVITAEYAPKAWRARMLAVVFLMQSLGQLLAAVINLAVVLSIGAKHGLQDLQPDDPASKIWVDSIWRAVIGVGLFPALIALVFRLTIPESPRYTMDVELDGWRALQDAEEYFDGHNVHGGAHENSSQVEMSGALVTPLVEGNDPPNSLQEAAEEGGEPEFEETEEEESDSSSTEPPDDKPKAFSRADLYDYFITEGSWRFLVGTSTCWFILDFAFYGLGINNPRQIAQIWQWQPLPKNSDSIPDWQTTDSTQNIYQVLKSDAIQYIITISIGSVVGSLLLVKFVDYIPRKALLSWTFTMLAGLFAIVGGSLFAVEYTNLHAVTITLYVLCQLAFNLGPNALTFMISAEIFPTRYRCTCHGISAASGKLGSIVVQAILSQTGFSSAQTSYLAITLLIFSAFMACGAFFSWIWLPDIQDPRQPRNAITPGAIESAIENNAEAGQGNESGDIEGPTESGTTLKSWIDAYKIPNKSLEELGEGYRSMVANGHNLGLRRKLGIYDLTKPRVAKIQEWLSKTFSKKEVKNE